MKHRIAVDFRVVEETGEIFRSPSRRKVAVNHKRYIFSSLIGNCGIIYCVDIHVFNKETGLYGIQNGMFIFNSLLYKCLHDNLTCLYFHNYVNSQSCFLMELSNNLSSFFLPTDW